jgi:NodT family efflux transporter outer membrane factor (OMF) lipoprotein
MSERRLSMVRAITAPLTCLALLALQACSTQQDVQPKLAALDASRLGVHQASPREVPAQPPSWWEAYGNAQLNQLVTKALSDNPTMQVVATRLRRVQAMETFTRGSDKPQLEASGEVDRQKFSQYGLYPPPLGGHAWTTGTLQLDSSWELDLFGKQRAELDAAVGQTRAAQADMQASALMLSAQVVRTYAPLERLQGLRDVLARILGQREETLGLIRQRVQAGLDTQVELKQGEGALPDARLQIEQIDEQMTLARHTLAILTGQAPQALDGLTVSADSLQPQPTPNHIPLDLLSRRADVMAALWRVQSAGHQVDAARALFYPNVDLVSYAGYNAIGLDQLLKASSFQWGLMPAIHLPLFDADRRRANLQGKVAEQDAAQASYNQTVLQALQEAADNISSVQAIVRQQAEQQSAQRSAESAYAFARARYQAGLGNYLIVLSAESAVLAQRRQAVELRARALDAQIGLVRALGGSLQPGEANTPVASGATPSSSSDSLAPQQAAVKAGDKS